LAQEAEETDQFPGLTPVGEGIVQSRYDKPYDLTLISMNARDIRDANLDDQTLLEVPIWGQEE